MATFVKQEDSRPFLDFTLKNSSNVAHNLTGATILFSMTKVLGKTPVLSLQSMSIMDATGGKVRYSPATTDWDTLEGEFFVELKATLSDTTVLRFPQNGYHKIIVQKKIA